MSAVAGLIAVTVAVTLPDANSFKFCNYTGVTRNFAIVLWH